MRALPVLAVLLLFLGVPFSSSAQTATNSFNMRVYSDGSAAIIQSVTVNASNVSITVPLLSAIITNVIATDQNGSPLSFQISGGNITIYTIGSTHVTIQYDTDSLTSKQGSVWTISFTTSYNLTVTLPAQSSLTSVSGTPTSLSEQSGSPIVVVSPGKWSISYGVPIQAGVSSTTSTYQTGSSNTVSRTSNSVSTNTTKVSGNPSSQFLELVIATIVIIAGGLFLLRRRNNSIREAQNTELRPDDIQVLNYISEKGGKVFEQEIRSRFTLPKTSAWRQIKRLERLGYLKVYKVGSQNQIELLKKVE
ncbi:MAG: helix-turn-helix transcriptional regulator [Nitrososphaerales archaeon]